MSRALGIASAIYAASVLCSRLIGLVREAVIGRVLGNGPDADVYFTAFVIPDFLNYLLAGGALSLVLIPIFAGHLARGDKAAAWSAFSSILSAVTWLIVTATAIAFVLAPFLVPLIAPGLDLAQQDKLVILVRILLPAQIFHVIGGVLTATLQARDRHAMPALAPLVYNLGIVVSGLLLGPTLGADGFAWGVLIGSFLGPFALPLYGCLREGDLQLRLFPELHLVDLRAYFLRSLPIMLGFSIVVFDDFLVRYFGSFLETGAIARLTYAKTLMRVPMGVFGLAIGMATFPALARLFGEGRAQEGHATLMAATRATLVLAFLAQAGLTVSGTEVATVIWGRERFTDGELSQIGDATVWVCLGLWAWSIQGLLSRGFYARGEAWAPSIIGSVVTVLATPLFFVLSNTYGVVGLAAASSIAISFNVFALAVLLRRRAGAHAVGQAFLGTLVRMGGATAVSCLLVSQGSATVALDAPALVRGAVWGGAAVVLSALFGLVLGVDELKALSASLSRRLKRRR
ncbi:MAG: murein biosynthesis integral membrane protein MurJ [Myxococcales bacterium]|nr:murein biosynthesis integral membrane protein MurJ [Myxococcales bacterium]